MKLPSKKLNPVVAAIVLIAVMLVVIIASWIFHLINQPNVDLLVAPSTATITIDGKTYTNGQHKIAPGTHQVSATLDGFTGYDEVIEVKDNETTKIYIALMPADGTYDWYLNHPEEQMVLNSIGDYEASQNAHSYVSQDIIFEKTPYYDERNLYQVFATPSADGVILAVQFNTCSETSAEIYKSYFNEWLLATVGADKAKTYTIQYNTLCE